MVFDLDVSICFVEISPASNDPPISKTEGSGASVNVRLELHRRHSDRSVGWQAQIGWCSRVCVQQPSQTRCTFVGADVGAVSDAQPARATVMTMIVAFIC